ncbi:MAG: serine hydrolase [Desulfobulbus sp.]|nr:serine hydrolase [Desulfobulbus sp.]
MENQINRLIADICEEGLRRGVFSAVSALVSVYKGNEYRRAVYSGGMTRTDGSAVSVNTSTYFDLASLTKPLCTTLCTLALLQQKLLSWDESCLLHLQTDLPSEKKAVTCRRILHHSSGLPAYQPYFSQFIPQSSSENKITLQKLILKEPLLYEPDSRCLYSDLGFILLGQVIEKITDLTLDQFYRTTVLEPLHLENSIIFSPAQGGKSDAKIQTAATELCMWRHMIMDGEVHDEHCWLMGGVCGHAGLFGNIWAVGRLCELLLDCWQARTVHPAFSKALLRYALEWSDNRSSWRLGFDTPTPGQSSSGRYLSPNSVGHLGFTGTSFWIDPEQEMIIILLTNRVHPSRENVKIRNYRPFFHDQVIEGLRRKQ